MDPMHEGVKITMGGREWIVPALSIGQVRRLGPDIAAVASAGDDLTPELVAGVVKIVKASISRNYPEVTDEQVEELIDLRNFRDIIAAIMGVSGLIQSGEAIGETVP